ncbi:MAG: hypothetical protein HND58_08940 [Planctomycetota bacterium]|nr:MAG: hypothetical protein HND58_08940 [Planctomycetota bacterium]
MAEPAGVGGDAEVEGGGDLDGEFVGGEVEELAAEVGDDLGCSGGGGVDDSSVGDGGVAPEVVVDDERAVAAAGDGVADELELGPGAGVDDDEGVGVVGLGGWVGVEVAGGGVAGDLGEEVGECARRTRARRGGRGRGG